MIDCVDMTPLQAVRGHDPSAAAAVQGHTAEVRCAAREFDAIHVVAARHAVSEVKRIANNTYYSVTQTLSHIPYHCCCGCDHRAVRDGHQPCQRRLKYIRIYHLFNLMMENNASCTIDIDLIISVHRTQHMKSPTIIIININCLSPSFIIITRS